MYLITNHRRYDGLKHEPIYNGHVIFIPLFLLFRDLRSRKALLMCEPSSTYQIPFFGWWGLIFFFHVGHTRSVFSVCRLSPLCCRMTKAFLSQRARYHVRQSTLAKRKWGAFSIDEEKRKFRRLDVCQLLAEKRNSHHSCWEPQSGDVCPGSSSSFLKMFLSSTGADAQNPLHLFFGWSVGGTLSRAKSIQHSVVHL